MESDQGIEQQQPWAMLLQRVVQPLLVAGAVEPEGVGGDDVQVNGVEFESAVATDPRDAISHVSEGVLGEVDEGRPGVADLEASEARGAGGDGDGEVEAEPGFAALCRVLGYAAWCESAVHGMGDTWHSLLRDAA